MQSVSLSTLNTGSAYEALKWTVDEIKWGTSTYISGLYTLLFHPIESIKNLGKAICNPLDTSETVAKQLFEHPLGSAVNVALSWGTGVALNYAIESSAVNMTLQTGLEASTLDTTATTLNSASSTIGLSELAATAFEATTSTVILIAEVASSRSMRLLRQAAKAISHFEIQD